MKLVYRLHAVRRMLQRRIGGPAVRKVIETGEVIATYPNDQPYPSRLLLGWSEGVPLHVLIADNSVDQETIVITVYRPDPDLWDPDFRKRRTP
jgi:Domain of unknown function (DUF4258)